MGSDSSLETKIFKGVMASNGSVAGPCFLYSTSELVLNNTEIKSSEIREHQERVESAFRILDLQLRKLIDLTLEESSSEVKEIIEFQRDILKDPELITSVNQFIRSEFQTADKAVHSAFRKYIDRLANSTSAYFKERVSDIREVRNRLISIIQQKHLLLQVKENDIVVCKEITPGDILLFSRKKVGGIVSEQGGVTSHAAIIANSVNIPLIMSVNGISDSVMAGNCIIIDGSNSEVIVNPSKAILDSALDYIKTKAVLDSLVNEFSQKSTQMACGYHIPLMANIELEEEFQILSNSKIEGIGLLRSEAFLLNKESFYNGDLNQSEIYKKAVETVGKTPVNIRLFDIGGDKLPSYSKPEPNPFLGWRGVRLLLDSKSLLSNQIDAILETSISQQKKINIIIPMVTETDDIIQIKELLGERFKRYPNAEQFISIGIMVEVPAVAVMAEKYMEFVDFVTIGTNDLTQYTLAADRTNRLVQKYFNQLHPAVWQLIHTTIKAGEKLNKQVALCGEIASNPKAAFALIGLGISSLSMSPAAIPRVRKFLSEYTKLQADSFANSILKASTSREVNTLFDSIK